MSRRDDPQTNELYEIAREIGKKQRNRGLWLLLAFSIINILVLIILEGCSLYLDRQVQEEIKTQNEQLDEAFENARVEQVRAEFRQQQLLAEFEERLVPRSEVVALTRTTDKLEQQVSILTRTTRRLTHKLNKLTRAVNTSGASGGG